MTIDEQPAAQRGSPVGRIPRWLRLAARVARASGWVTLSVVVVLGGDSLGGIFYRTGTDAHLHVTVARTAQTSSLLIVFPGYVMPGELLSEAFAPYLPSDQAMIVVQYADRGIDMNKIYQQIMAESRRLDPLAIKVYGASMGGMCAVEFLRRYAHDDMPFGHPTLVLDTAPSAVSQVRQPAWVFDLARWYRGGPLTTAIWAALVHASAQSPPDSDANPKLVAEAHHAGAWAGIPTLTTQAQFMADLPPLRHDELVGVVNRVVFLRGHGPAEDPVIKVGASIAAWRQAFPAMTVDIVETRDARWHIPLIERPRETMEAIVSA